MGTLIAIQVKRLATALLFLNYILWHDVMMMCDFTRLGIALNIILFIILINPLPLLASRAPNRKERERLRQQAQEERQSEFVKGKSKFEVRKRKSAHGFTQFFSN